MGGPLAAQAAPEGPSSGVMESPGSPGKRKRVAAGPLDAWELDAAAGEGRLLHLLSRATLGDALLDDRAPVLLQHNMTIGEALTELADRGVLSAPLVITPDLEDSSEGMGMDAEPFATRLASWLGWVDVHDVAAGLLRYLSDCAGPAGMSTTPEALARDLERLGPAYLSRTLVTLGGGQDRSLLSTSDLATSVLRVIQEVFLARQPPPSGSQAPPEATPRVVHRAAVFNEWGEITHIVSQMDVIRHLHKHMGELDGWAGTMLRDTPLLSALRPLVTVLASQPMAMALKLVQDCGHSSAAVVDDEGTYVGCISSGDLRNIRPDQLSVLAWPCGLFLARPTQKAIAGYPCLQGTMNDDPDATEAHWHSSGAFFSAATEGREARMGGGSESGAGPRQLPGGACTAEATVGEVIREMAATRRHQVWVLDVTRRPIAVVTPTDILSLAAAACRAADTRFTAWQEAFEARYANVVRERDAEAMRRLASALAGPA